MLGIVLGKNTVLQLSSIHSSDLTPLSQLNANSDIGRAIGDHPYSLDIAKVLLDNDPCFRSGGVSRKFYNFKTPDGARNLMVFLWQ